MQVNEILKLSAIFAGEEEVASSLMLNPVNALMEPEEEDLTPVIQDDESVIQKANTFLTCLNLIIEDIAKDYLPLLCEEEIAFTDKKFEYNKLSNVISDVIKLQTLTGLSLKFKCFPSFIKAETNKAVITYTYLPDEVTFGQEFNFFDNKLTPRIIAYGVAMEYLFLNSLSDESAIWESRFLNSLESALRKKHNVTLPKRRWL